MELTINKEKYHFELDDVANAKVSFSLRQGRRFTLKTQEGPIKISLKTLQRAVCSSDLEAEELEGFYNEFVKMRGKGYKNAELDERNLLVRFIARVLHHFSKKPYNKLMNQLGNSFEKKHISQSSSKEDTPPPSVEEKNPDQIVLDEWNKEYSRIVNQHHLAKTKPNTDLKKHRIALYNETVRAANEGFFVGNDRVQLDEATTENMIKNQKTYSGPINGLPAPDKLYDTVIEVVYEDTFELAERYAKEGLKPVGLNLANAKTPGGGVKHGSGAQEESLFRRSNYHVGLTQATGYPLNGTKAVYTPSVQVFRTPEIDLTNADSTPDQPDSYQFREPFAVDMIACAAIKLGKNKALPNDYEQITREKIHLILSIAAEQGHDSLVLGAFGCGAFNNPPDKISKYFKEALELPEFKGRFKKVGFAIIYAPELTDAFKEKFP